VQFQPGTFRSSDSTAGPWARGAILNGVLTSRVGLGWQINERTFVSANTGLCPFSNLQNSQLSLRDFQSVLGLKVEHRLTRGYALTFGLEPGSQSLLDCRGEKGSATTSRILPYTPPQVGVDLKRTWSF
jgi:hypothetical protein